MMAGISERIRGLLLLPLRGAPSPEPACADTAHAHRRDDLESRYAVVTATADWAPGDHVVADRGGGVAVYDTALLAATFAHGGARRLYRVSVPPRTTSYAAELWVDAAVDTSAVSGCVDRGDCRFTVAAGRVVAKQCQCQSCTETQRRLLQII